MNYKDAQITRKIKKYLDPPENDYPKKLALQSELDSVVLTANHFLQLFLPLNKRLTKQVDYIPVFKKIIKRLAWKNYDLRDTKKKYQEQISDLEKQLQEKEQELIKQKGNLEEELDQNAQEVREEIYAQIREVIKYKQGPIIEEILSIIEE